VEKPDLSVLPVSQDCSCQPLTKHDQTSVHVLTTHSLYLHLPLAPFTPLPMVWWLTFIQYWWHPTLANQHALAIAMTAMSVIWHSKVLDKLTDKLYLPGGILQNRSIYLFIKTKVFRPGFKPNIPPIGKCRYIYISQQSN